MKSKNVYLSLAELFKYPDEGIDQRIFECETQLGIHFPEVVETLKLFSDQFLKLNQHQKEELFTKTFDVQPVCYLDLGYVIFGEDYKRGSFLLHMKEEQDKIGVTCSPELPDHLYHVLNLMVAHPDKDFIDELARKIVIPGVNKLILEFETSKVELKLKVLRKLHNAIIQEELNMGNIYQYPFKALLTVLKADYPDNKSTSENETIEENKAAFFSKERQYVKK